MNDPHFLDVFSASRTSHAQWNSTEPGSAAHPERDGTEKGQSPWLRCFWDCLQGITAQERWTTKICCAPDKRINFSNLRSHFEIRKKEGGGKRL